MSFDLGTHVGYEDSLGRAHCCACLDESEACGVLYLGDLPEAENDETVCVVCRYRLVAFLFACDWCDGDASDGVVHRCGRACRVCDVEHSSHGDDVVGWRLSAVSDAVWCSLCFIEFWDDGDDGEVFDVVTCREALRLSESRRRCSMCRDLLCW